MRSTLKTIFILAAFVFMGFSAWKLVKQVGSVPESLNFTALVFSLILVWAGFLSAICVWRFLLSSYGEHAPFLQTYRIYFQANLGKYLPGKVWQLAGMIFLCREIGIRAGKSLPASLYNQAAAVLSGIALLVVVLPGKLGDPGDAFLWYILAGAGLLLFAFFPGLLASAMNRALRMLGKEEIRERISRRALFVSLAGYLVSWCIFGFSFHVFLGFLGLQGDLSLLEASGVLSGSVSIGFLAFFSPGGIGVREGVMVFLLEGIYPASTAVFISLVTRLWITAAEFLGFLSTYLIPARRVEEPKERVNESTIS